MVLVITLSSAAGQRGEVFCVCKNRDALGSPLERIVRYITTYNYIIENIILTTIAGRLTNITVLTRIFCDSE